MKLVYSLTMLALLGSQARAEEAGKVVVTPVTTMTETSSGQPIVMPGRQARVIVSIYTIPPDAKLPEHKHLHIRYGYMQSGSLSVSNLATGKVQQFKAGDFVIEALDQWHKAENPGNEPVKLLVIDQLDINDKEGGNVVLR